MYSQIWPFHAKSQRALNVTGHKKLPLPIMERAVFESVTLMALKING
jgi:hypothetical protein